MAIKKRTPKTEEERAAAIAAFGDGATAQPGAAAEASAPAPTAPPAKETSGEVPKTSLVRWTDEDLPRRIQRIAAVEDRSFHKTMLQLLRRGVDHYDSLS